MDELTVNQKQYTKDNKFKEYVNMSRASYSKKDYESARKHITDALNIFPDNLDARELNADILLASGETNLASSEYKAIYDRDKTRTQTEKKYAETVLALYNQEQEPKLKDLLPPSINKTPLSVGIYIISFFVPGLTQILLGQRFKGVTIIIISILLMYINFKKKAFFSENQNLSFNTPVIWCLFALIIYAIIDGIISKNKR